MKNGYKDTETRTHNKFEGIKLGVPLLFICNKDKKNKIGYNYCF